MSSLEMNLPAPERVVLAVDTSERAEAERLITLAGEAGARFVKLGLEIQSATSWRECSEMAAAAGVEWVADAKLDDIPNTTASAVKNIVGFDHPPAAITIHANSGVESMRAAQDIAGEAGVMMLGVTHLTSISEAETKQTYRFGRNIMVGRRMLKMVEAGLDGYVCSPRELEAVVEKKPAFRSMFGMIPGTRSKGADAHDQKNTRTPAEAIEYGANLLVIGRQVTNAANPAEALQKVVTEIEQGIELHSIRQKFLF